MNSSDSLVEKKIKEAEELLKKKDEEVLDEDSDYDKVLSDTLDKQLAFAFDMIDQADLKSLKRLFKYHLAFPFKHKEVKVTLQKKELFPNNIFSNIMEIKSNMVKNLVLDDIKRFHDEEADKVKEKIEEKHKALTEESNNG